MGVIKVKFDRGNHYSVESKEYCYFCEYPVSVGERVIVDSPSTGYTTVTVTQTGAGLDSIKATKEVVCVIDDSRYRARKAARDRIAEIEAELAYREKTISLEKRRKKLFKGDKIARSLLEEAEGLTHILHDNPEGFLDSKLSGADVTFLECDLETLERILHPNNRSDGY